jgi:hypothetical protein
VLVPRHERVAPSIVQAGPERTPAFAFDVRQGGALPTAAIRIRKPVRSDPLLRLRGASRVASTKAIASITRFYRGAFLDPANWRSGTYESLWRDFARSTKGRARRDVGVLTAGAAARRAYLAIVPRRSSIDTTVLLDPMGKPAMILADARFRALGRVFGGASNTLFDSAGRFFLQRVGGGWEIVSYDVRRSDEKVGEPAPSSPSPSATGAP